MSLNLESLRKSVERHKKYIPSADVISQLLDHIEILQASQKALVEAADTTLEYFRIEEQYQPEERGFARLNVEEKLKAAQIEVEAMTAIANLQDENRELRQEIQRLKRNQCRLAEVCQNLVDYTIGLFWSEKTPGIEDVAEIAEARAA